MCYVLWYISCYITCYVQAGLLDQPRIENQWCYIAGSIPQCIAGAILSAIQHMVMLYSTCIYHAIQQIRLYSSPHIQHLAIQHICYIAGMLYTMLYSSLLRRAQGVLYTMLYSLVYITCHSPPVYSIYFTGMSQPSGYDIALEPFGCQFEPCPAPSWCGLRRCLELLG